MRQNILKKFLTESKNISKDSYRWNLVSSMLFAFQSVFILMILTRAVGLENAGIFTIAYANASLFLFIGKYGVRHFQVSDVSHEHKFGDYHIARVFSVLAMILSSVAYVVYGMTVNDYSYEKGMIILLTCLIKVPDALEDVYYGEYQRRGRLDIGAKAMAVRLGTTFFVLLFVVLITKNLILALSIAMVASFVLLYVLLSVINQVFILKDKWKCKRSSVYKIFISCFPLFMGSFLAQYIGNAPKYAIDEQLDDTIQACYGFLSMPVFVISLLGNIVFTPAIYSIAENWKQNRKKAFLKRFIQQVFIVSGITVICICGAALVGTPVLGWMYNTELSMYRTELLILLLGGGLFALTGVVSTMLTIMRFQQSLLSGYIVVSLIAFLQADKIILRWGIRGAACFYAFLMLILLVIFLLLFFIALFIDKYRRKK